ncbi:hypothetical protein ACFV9W_01820 [Streptomyces sp. NPDC059897]|uniref:hypothetical protein n=1 Tax=Streptomyces sp. NPDC059897 TaxID=3346994 RepID=UPI003658A6B9
MHTTTKRLAAALFLAASAASLATPAVAGDAADGGLGMASPDAIPAEESLTAPASADNASDADPGLDPAKILTTGTISSQGAPTDFLG